LFTYDSMLLINFHFFSYLEEEKKNPVYRPWIGKDEKRPKKFFDSGIRLVLEKKLFYHYDYIQIHKCTVLYIVERS